MWSYYLKLVGQFWQDMRRQKLRTFLTVFGITWGTVAVVLLLSFGVGLQRHSMKMFHGMGANILIFGGNRTSLAYRGLGTGRWIGLREEDAALLRDRIPWMEFISPDNNKYVRLAYKRETRMVSVAGVYPGYEELRSLIPAAGGRFINGMDQELKRRVVFIGNATRDRLFGKGSEAVGKILTINGSPFTVIGVMVEKVQTSSYMSRDEDAAFIPFATYKEMFGGEHIQRLICRATDPLWAPAMKKEIYRVLGSRHKFDPEDKEALWMWDTSEGERFMSLFFLGFQAFLGLGGAFTLLVGGIGVANIMYVVVRERRKELGIKAALGATPRTILMQFLIETFLIVATGGLTGFAISYGVVALFNSPLLAKAQQYIGSPVINPLVAFCAIGVLGLGGFAAGWAPARRAANMDPVQALEF